MTYDVIEETRRVCEHNRRDYEALAKMSGKTIAEVEADTTAPDPSGEHLHKLSSNMSVEFDGGNVVLYDTCAYNPRRLTMITAEEMAALLPLYTDGCCPICLEEIALHDIICDDCLERARNMRRLARP